MNSFLSLVLLSKAVCELKHPRVVVHLFLLDSSQKQRTQRWANNESPVLEVSSRVVYCETGVFDILGVAVSVTHSCSSLWKQKLQLCLVETFEGFYELVGGSKTDSILNIARLLTVI